MVGSVPFSSFGLEQSLKACLLGFLPRPFLRLQFTRAAKSVE